ncbi:hypothetical protein [Clostridium pasteurianum]|uniref:Uncharacterized protein n=1 Tax=Clostridium pasteurianum BC1 TaxID=86416 RepID=R4K7B3_CLOPA|nr:hypothetical protein [Clostridium pasteurianum]AGK97591.1 hypothetical protein Clopa_2751 [Clostridium pasteurianum BC1]
MDRDKLIKDINNELETLKDIPIDKVLQDKASKVASRYQISASYALSVYMDWKSKQK